MGVLQPDDRHRRGDGSAQLSGARRSAAKAGPAFAVTVFALEHAQAAVRAAAELEVPVTLVSMPYGASAVGSGWFGAVVRLARRDFPGVPVTAVLDCGDRADLVQAALRDGLRDVCFTGDPRLRRKLADIAAQCDARLHAKLPEGLDLSQAPDPLAACRDWLRSPRRRGRIEKPQGVVYCSSPSRKTDRPRPSTRRTP